MGGEAGTKAMGAKSFKRGARPRRVVPLALFAVLATMAATAGAAQLMHELAQVAGRE